MPPIMQRDLFSLEDNPTSTGLFADVVFDRPLDHAFTYAVGEPLPSRIAASSVIVSSISSKPLSSIMVFMD